jgi:hypothetical protein
VKLRNAVMNKAWSPPVVTSSKSCREELEEISSFFFWSFGDQELEESE